MAEINTALPAMIDNTIGTVEKLSHCRSAPLDKTHSVPRMPLPGTIHG